MRIKLSTKFSKIDFTNLLVWFVSRHCSWLKSPKPVKLFRTCSLLPCLVAVFCLVEVSLFCFDWSVITLCFFRRTSVTPMFSLYPHFMLLWAPISIWFHWLINTWSARPSTHTHPQIPPLHPHTHTHSCTHTHTHTHTCMYTHTVTCMHTHTHTQIHVHTHTHNNNTPPKIIFLTQVMVGTLA